MDLENSGDERASTSHGATDDENEQDILLNLGGTSEFTNHKHTDNGNEEHLLLDLGGITEIQLERASSTSSSSSSEEDFIQLDGKELGNPSPGSEDTVRDGKELGNPSPGSEDTVSDISSPLLSIDGAELAPELDFQVYTLEGTKIPNLDQDVGSQDDIDDMHEAKQSPPTQVMVRTDVPDPFRIPPSIFERNKSTAPMEWSVASNESLFSIHMGTNSFSRDHAILLDMSTELPGLPLLAPPLTVGTTNSGKARNDGLRDSVIEQFDDDKTPAESPRPTTSQSYHSDGSPSSTNSFAFPILIEGQITSMKVERERHHQSQRSRQPERKESQKPEVAPTPTWRSWFTCFSCFHCC